MIRPYYETEHITLYHGDAREVLPDLDRVDSVITDPVWPNALKGLPGSDDPFGLFASVAIHFPKVADRCVIQLGCNSDVRILLGVPDSMPYFRTCWLEYIRPNYIGRTLNTGDVAYVFGTPLPSEPGKHLMPGRFIESRVYPKFKEHPCPRIIGHVRWLVHWYGGRSVIDPFAGGCTTAIACREAGIHCTCIEISEEFCDAAVRRFETDQRSIFELDKV